VIELRTLGAVDLRDLAGHEVRPVLQQPNGKTRREDHRSRLREK
jgi:hypothetical protein